MLTQEENERLTRVGPGTPAGNLLRRYWQPVAAASLLAEREVMPIRIMGEDLVLFKDRAGRVGLVGDRCAHRLVKLECGYTTGAGLRCPYHGWTYDTQGRCVDQPGEPAGSTFKEKVTIPSYPVEELSGVIFAYLGPEPRPLLPRWDRLVWENAFRVIAYGTIPCNWLQCVENTPDPVHAQFLHGQFFLHWLEKNGLPADRPEWKLARGFNTAMTKFDHAIGKYGINRKRIFVGQDQSSEDEWDRFPPMIFPNTNVTSGGGRHYFGWRVPMDDTSTMQIVVRVFQPGDDVTIPPQTTIPYQFMPTLDAQGNHESMDTINGQDWMAWQKQGPIMDRTRERLGQSDQGIIMYRQLLQAQIKVVEEGGEPINTFRDPAANERIDLPNPWDRGFSWAYAKDGTYIPGAATAGEGFDDHIAAQIEELFIRAAEQRGKLAAV